MWKTINAGTTFIPLWDHMPIASIGDIAIAPSDPKVIYVGTGEGNSRNSVAPGWGVYKSTDGGVTWQSVGLEKTQHVGRIVIHPTNPNIAYVAAVGATWASNPERGLYKTIDGGKTWTAEQVHQRQGGLHRRRDGPARSEHALRGVVGARARPVLPQERRSRARRSGRRPTPARTGARSRAADFPRRNKGRMNIQIAPSNPNIVYVMVEADSIRGAKPQRLLSGLYRSTDAGQDVDVAEHDQQSPVLLLADSRRPEESESHLSHGGGFPVL